MEVAEKMGFVGLLFFRRANVALDGRAKAAPNEKVQFTRSKRRWLVYTQLCLGTQNGNPSLKQNR